jgi:WD40 repeat protein
MSFLFCDLVASTQLMVEVGEAANDELRRDIFEVLRGPIAPCKGVEVKSQGDGLMVAFEGSITDAIRCAGGMQRGIARLASMGRYPKLELRIGVASGEATTEDGDWFGTAVVQAARLCALAGPGQILVPSEAMRGADLDFMPLPAGPRQLKGLAGDLDCASVPWVRESPPDTVAPVPPALDTSLEPSFTGHDDELTAVLEGWHRAELGQSTVMLLTGPAHAGRTRLVAETANSVAAGGGLVMYGAAVRNAPLYQVLADALRNVAVWGPRDLVDELAQIAGFTTLVPAVAVRRAAPLPPTPIYEMPPERVAVIVEAALAHLSRWCPVLFVLDDLQWADAASLAAVLAMAASERQTRVFIVGTFRELVESTATGLDALVDKLRELPHVSVLHVGPLGRDEVADLVRVMAPSLPAADASRVGALVAAAVGSAVGEVVTAVRQVVGSFHTGFRPPDVRVALSRCAPYKGLVPFEADDASVFFGRDELVAKVIDHLRRERFLAIVGASGSGKSSLLRAGVGPAWSTGLVTIASPMLVSEEGGRTGLPDSGGLIIDQFEELFTMFDRDRQNAFIAGLFEVLDYGSVEWLAIAIRGDFYGHCASHPRLADEVANHTMLVRPLDQTDLRVMVERPAAVSGLRVEPGLADVVVADVAGEPYPLPLVSHALLETWRLRRGDKLTVGDYHEAGGIRRAIATTAERLYTTELDGWSQQIARELLLRLIEPGDGTADTRHILPLGELHTLFGESADRVLDALIDARLVVADDAHVGLAHEALITSWPRLQGWLDDERTRLQTASHLGRATRDWETRGRPGADLYRGARLDAALELLAAGHRVTPLEQEYIDSSETARTAERRNLRRTNRRLRRLLVGTVMALVIAVVASAIAVAQRNSADRQQRNAEISRTAADARQLTNSNIELSMLLALEAQRLGHRPETLSTLEYVLRAQPEIARVVPLPSWSTNSRLLATARDGRVVVFAAGDDIIPVSLPSLKIGTPVHVPQAAAGAMSPDDQTVAVGTPTGITLVDIASGRAEPQLATSPPPETVTYTDDHDIIVTGSGAISSVNLTTGTVVILHPTELGVSLAAIVDDTGTRVTTAEIDKSRTALDSYDVHGDGRIVQAVDIFTSVGDLHQQPGGQLVAVGTATGVLLADLGAKTVTPLTSVPLPSSGVFSPDGKRIATLDSAGTLTVYDAATHSAVLAPVTQALGAADVSNSLKTRLPSGVTFGPDSDTLFVIGTGRILQIDLSGRQPLATAPFGRPGLQPGAVRSDGAIAYGIDAPPTGPASSIEFDTTTGRQLATVDGVVLQFGPGDAYIVRYDDAGTLVADAPDGRKLGQSSAPPGTFRFISDDGHLLLSVSTDGQTHLERLPAMEQVKITIPPTAANDTVTAIAITNDGRTLGRAIHHDGAHARVEILDTVTGTPVRSALVLSDDNGVVSQLAFSADGRNLAIAETTVGVGIIDLTSGQFESGLYKGVRADFAGLGYSQDGASVFAAGTEGTFWWWDAASHQSIGDPFPSDASGPGPDIGMTHWLIADGTALRVWNLDTAAWQQVACGHAGRNLTRDEWHRYLPSGEPYHITCPGYPAN